MARTKTKEATLETKWPTEMTFVISATQVNKLSEWKAAHDTLFGICDEDEYEYVFNTDGNDVTILVRNTVHDTEIDLTDETSW